MKPEQDPAVRLGKITGSNASAFLGLNVNQSPNEACDQFWGKTPYPDLSENRFVAAGTWAEEMIGKRFAKEMGLKIRFINKTYTSKDWPIATGHIDAKIQGQKVGLEIKTASEFKKKDYSESLTPNPKIPVQYRCQINHYLYLTNWDYWWLAVLIGGNDFRVFKIERDEDAVQEQVRKLKEFYGKYLLPQLSPPAITPEEALYIFPSADPEEKSIEATPLFMDLVAEAKKIEEEEKLLKIRKAENHANIQNIIQDATYVYDPNSRDRIAQWKNGSSSRLDQKALRQDMPELWHNDKYISKSTYRTLKIL